MPVFKNYIKYFSFSFFKSWINSQKNILKDQIIYYFLCRNSSKYMFNVLYLCLRVTWRNETDPAKEQIKEPRWDSMCKQHTLRMWTITADLLLYKTLNTVSRADDWCRFQHRWTQLCGCTLNVRRTHKHTCCGRSWGLWNVVFVQTSEAVVKAASWPHGTSEDIRCCSTKEKEQR